MSLNHKTFQIKPIHLIQAADEWYPRLPVVMNGRDLLLVVGRASMDALTKVFRSRRIPPWSRELVTVNLEYRDRYDAFRIIAQVQQPFPQMADEPATLADLVETPVLSSVLMR